MLIVPITPTSKLDAAMMAGHYARTGHELVAHKESEDGALFTIVRKCC